jgi:hypothetical protein
MPLKSKFSHDPYFSDTQLKTSYVISLVRDDLERMPDQVPLSDTAWKPPDATFLDTTLKATWKATLCTRPFLGRVTTAAGANEHHVSGPFL